MSFFVTFIPLKYALAPTSLLIAKIPNLVRRRVALTTRLPPTIATKFPKESYVRRLFPTPPRNATVHVSFREICFPPLIRFHHGEFNRSFFPLSDHGTSPHAANCGGRICCVGCAESRGARTGRKLTRSGAAGATCDTDAWIAPAATADDDLSLVCLFTCFAR